MGKIFKYVADNALYSVDDFSCHQCETNSLPIYNYFGRVIDPKKTKHPEIAEEEPDVDYLCADCINGDNTKRKNTYDVEESIAKYAKNKDKTWEEFHKIPTCPDFMQGFDWPICCGNWAEFIGRPDSYEKCKEIQIYYKYWRKGFADWKEDNTINGVVLPLAPEVLSDVSIFRCVHCEQNIFVYQGT